MTNLKKLLTLSLITMLGLLTTVAPVQAQGASPDQSVGDTVFIAANDDFDLMLELGLEDIDTNLVDIPDSDQNQTNESISSALAELSIDPSSTVVSGSEETVDLRGATSVPVSDYSLTQGSGGAYSDLHSSAPTMPEELTPVAASKPNVPPFVDVAISSTGGSSVIADFDFSAAFVSPDSLPEFSYAGHAVAASLVGVDAVYESSELHPTGLPVGWSILCALVGSGLFLFWRRKSANFPKINY